jgi:hypothetical protein
MAPEEAGLTLLVAIVAADPVRRLGLAALVTRAGHQVLESHEGADVVLADDVAVCSDGPPVVALGAADAGSMASRTATSGGPRTALGGYSQSRRRRKNGNTKLYQNL